MPDGSANTPGQKRHVEYSVVALLALLAFVIRSLPYKNFLGSNGNYLLYGPDSYDHVRRIMLGITSLPRVPSYDFYYGYPVGTAQVWSPLFDYLISIMALLAGGSEQMVYTIGFWLPPLMAAATVIVVWLAAERMLGAGSGCTAALLLALLPGHILYSFVSELDHHVAEPLVFLGLMLSLMKWTTPSGRLLSGSKYLPGWLRTAGWLLLALFIWRGSVIFWGMAFGALLLELFFKRKNHDDSVKLGRYAACTFTAASVLLALCCLAGWMGATGGLNSRTTSWFHVLFLIGCAVAVRLAMQLLNSRTAGRFFTALGGVATLLLVAVLIPGSRSFVLQFFGGLGVLFAHDPWLDSISELRPMLYPTGHFALWHSVETLSMFYWLVPILAGVMLYRKIRGYDTAFASTLFLVTSLLLWLLPLFRERYINLGALSVAFSGALAIRMLYDSLSARFGRTLSIACCTGVMVLMLLPVWSFAKAIPAMGLPDNERVDLMETLLWLRDKTPQTSYYQHPTSRPEYGVLSSWGLGAYISAIARRPTVATNFGWETHGLYESAAFMTSTDQHEAKRIVAENRVRYVIMGYNEDLEQSYAIARQVRSKAGRLESPAAGFNPLQTTYIQLYYHNGAAYMQNGSRRPAFDAFRLVYESRNGVVVNGLGFVPYYKVFERVTQ